MTTDLALLARAHSLFAGHPGLESVGAVSDDAAVSTRSAGVGVSSYRTTAATVRAVLAGARATDSELSAILAGLHRDHQRARHDTGAVLAAARRDAVPEAALAYSPVLARELLRRRRMRLRAQRAHVLAARRRARRRRRRLRALRYATPARPAAPIGPSSSRGRAAVRAALSRLGCPYVWGATGPDRFDCSGLVQWSYARAGIPLPRTTYDQINEGIPVARSDVRPGDLVFPHSGHVQLAIGNNLVVEAPHPGANVQVSPLGASIAIRRPRF